MFVVLNSILNTTNGRSIAGLPMTRNAGNGRSDIPNGSPVSWSGEKQRAWLKEDLSKIQHDTPIVVFSASSLCRNLQG